MHPPFAQVKLNTKVTTEIHLLGKALNRSKLGTNSTFGRGGCLHKDRSLNGSILTQDIISCYTFPIGQLARA